MFIYVVLYAIGYRISQGFDHIEYSVKPKAEMRHDITPDNTRTDKRVFYDDFKSNYCFEVINDTTLQLRCVCSCDSFKNRNK